MSIVGRRKLNHPAPAATGGAGLHAAVELLYEIIANDLSGRYKAYSAIANSVTTTVDHDFGVALDEMSVLLYTGTYPNLTKVENPTAAGWTIVATTGNEKTKIDVTAPASGGPHTFALFMLHGRTAKFLDDLDDVDLAVAPEDGQAMVFDAASGDWKPGASGDASFKIQSVSDPNATIKGGYMLLDDGRELATYDGAGTASTDFGKDLTISLDTVLGGNPANATAYYFYVDLNSLGAATTQSDTGRVVYPITISNFVLLTTAPEVTDGRRYIPRSVIKSATTGTVWSGSGAGVATLAFLSAQTVGARGIEAKIPVNYIDVPTPTRNIGSAITYADAAAATPADGTGGSPNVTLVRNTTSPIRGLADYKFSKDAANRQGQGFSIPFTIPATDKGIKARMKFRYNASAANYAAGDMVMYVYDVTNSVLLTPVVTALPKNTGIFETSFDLTTGVSYRLIGHVATVNATAYDVYFDDFQVDIERSAPGAAIGEWESWTPTGNWSTNVTYTGKRRRVGSSMEYAVHLAFAGAPTVVDGTDAYIALPSGDVIDTSALPTSSTAFITVLGEARAYDSATATYLGAVVYRNTGTVYIAGNSASNLGLMTAANPFTFGAGDSIAATWSVPLTRLAGQGVLNTGAADVEYAYNSSTSTSTDTTNFAYGPAGALLTAHSGCNKRVRFTTPHRDGDVVVVQFREGLTGPWLDLGQFVKSDASGIDSLTYQSATGFGAGVSMVSGSTTDFDLRMSNYAQQAAASYGGAGLPWSGYTTVYWRLKKTRAGAVVGFGAASATQSGLVPAYETGTLSLSGSGSFTGGTLYYTRVGNLVTLAIGSITHASAAGVSSAAGLLPASLRPQAGFVNNLGVITGSPASATRMEVSSDGSISVSYYDQAFAGISKTGVGSMTISYPTTYAG